MAQSTPRRRKKSSLAIAFEAHEKIDQKSFEAVTQHLKLIDDHLTAQDAILSPVADAWKGATLVGKIVMGLLIFASTAFGAWASFKNYIHPSS